MFEKVIKETEAKKEIAGSLYATLKLGFAEISGDVDIEVDETEKVTRKTLNYKFLGNADISPPTSFDEAMLLMKIMPEHAVNNSQVVSFTIR